MKKKRKFYTIEFETKMKDRLQKIAEREHRSLASHIRFVLESYLNDNR